MNGEEKWPSLPANRTATGESHEVAPEELFFSTTDELGVITAANPVFVRLARFGYQELMGAPHSIIRHPVMPGGAFKLMWDTLKAGEPFCAYVDNLASGGSTYSVFATITPLGEDSYISIRCRPRRTDLRGAAFQLYGPARARELEARGSGASARTAAEIGLENLALGLRDAGFAEYEAFMQLALTAEVGLRLTLPPAVRPWATGPAADLLAAANNLSEELGAWLAHQAKLAEVEAQLEAAIPKLRASMDDALSTAKSLAATVKSGFSPLMVWIDLWARMMDAIDPVLADVMDTLTDLRRACLRTGFRVSLAVLHTQTVCQCAVELIDDVTVPDYDPRARSAAIAALGQALAEGFSATRHQDVLSTVAAASAAEQLGLVRDLMGIPQQLIASWKQLATTRNDDLVLTILPRMTEQMGKTDATLALLDELRESVSSITQSAPAERVNPALDRTLRAMDALRV